MSTYQIPPIVNYTGNKFKLLPDILKCIPHDVTDVYDLFTGSSVVGVNIKKQHPHMNVVINDILTPVLTIINTLKQVPTDVLLERIFTLQKLYHLPSKDPAQLTDKTQYKKGFYQLRDDLNHPNCSLKGERLLLLFAYSFSHSYRENKQGKINIPIGNGYLNPSLIQKIKENSQFHLTHNIILNHTSYKNVPITGKKAFVYLDPPYFITQGMYNNHRFTWSLEDEIELYKYLDKLNDQGVYFLLSNVLLHKNKKNPYLETFIKSYHVITVDKHYHHLMKGVKQKTEELLVTNINL